MDDPVSALRKENERLQKINKALMARVEKSMSSYSTPVALFESNNVLGNLVRERTDELQHKNAQLTYERTLLDSVLHSLPGKIFIFNGALEIQAIQEGSGTPFPVLHRERMDLALGPDFGRALGEELKKLSPGESSRHREFEHQTEAGGQPFIYRIAISVFPDGVIYLAYVRNVTAERTAELRNSQIYHALDEVALVAITDAKGKILEANEKFCSLGGYTRDELMGKDHRTLNSGQHSKAFFRNLWNTVLSGKIWSKDLVNKAKDGHFYHLRTVIAPLRSISGTIEQFISLSFDITEQKQAEQHLLTNQRLDQVIANTSLDISFTDTMQEVLKVICDLEGMDCGQFWVPDSLETEVRLASTYARSSTFALFQKVSAEKPILMGQGVPGRVAAARSIFYLPPKVDVQSFPRRATYAGELGFGVGVPVFLQDRLAGVVELFREGSVKVTPDLEAFLSSLGVRIGQLVLRNNERLKVIQTSKLASLGEMSAGIAHEINNPLGIISGSVGLLSKFREQPEKFEQKVVAIEKAVARLTKIVRGLKKFSRSSEEKPHEICELSSLITEALSLTEAKSTKHAVVVTSELSEGLNVPCDLGELQQVLIILVNNGVDAIQGQADKWVKVITFREGSEAVLRVIDSGSGISQAVESKLFQPFFTTKAVGEGTGLGLSIAKGILDQHRAKIFINRNLPNTCFEIRLPLAAPAAG